MTSEAKTVDLYLKELPEERKEPILRLREVILKNLPKGFEEGMGYGMIAYYVPHSRYPNGYHCDPKLPLPFMNLASQKNFIALYSMTLYSNKELLDWFQGAHQKTVGKKPDMGKSCIRFKNMKTIPYELIGTLASKVSVEDWIRLYETNLKLTDKS